MSFAKPLWFLFAVAILPQLASADDAPYSGASRMATFQDAGSHFFALSLLPDAEADFPRPESYEVVVVFDTSATQTGPVRLEGLEVLDELAATLPAGTSLSLLACDVETVELSEGLVASSDPKWETAVARLKKRIPLGATDLSSALRTAMKQFRSPTAQRTVVYIGDGVNRVNFLTSNEHRQLVDDLVEARVTVSSLAIGPMVDVPTLAAFANHTGGIVLSRNAIQESTQAIGRTLGLSAAMPVVWVENAKLPTALADHFPQRFPPLRLDRDTVIVGKVSGELTKADAGITGSITGQSVKLSFDIAPEASNPDMGFLTAVVEKAGRDGGLTLPSLGSEGLRAMSFMLADDATAMVKSGEFALKSGQIESAIQIAEEALKSDPNNAAAVSLLNAAKKAADKDAAAIPAGKFMQTGGNPFGDDDPFGNAPAGQEPTTDPFGLTPATEPAPATAPLGTGATPLVVPQATAPAPIVQSRVFQDSNLGDLLAEEEALRRVAGEALAQDVRNELHQARILGLENPIGVKNSLKLLLEELDSTVDIDPALRSQLRNNVSSAIANVAILEARYLDRVQRREAINAQANAAERLLNETARRDESLKQLVEQFNFLMDERRYLEASQDVAPEIRLLAPDTPLENVTREVSSLASNYAIMREAFENREQGFVNVMRAVEVASVPFEGDPPVVYPPADVWQALTARRRERYSEFNISGGGNETERRISTALKQTMEEINYNDVPLRTVIQEIEQDFNIPIWINEEELETTLDITPDDTVKLVIAPISLRSALRLMLDSVSPDLTYIVRNEVLEITSKDSAEAEPVNKVYPVGDLVLGPMQLRMMGGGGMMGGMRGGMGGMGGGMGGMGGGMGGMGGGMGGMGGMGGGMGGMGMGGMGGMFAVPDDTRKPTPLSTSRSSSAVNVEQWVERLTDATDEDRAEIDSKVRRTVRGYIDAAEAQLEAKNEAAAAAEFEKVIELVGGLLGAGHPQPWMYQALSLSMEACKYPAADIKRVQMSSIDFDGSTQHSILIANYLARKGFKAEALDILKDISVIEPLRYDVFATALPLAQETRDLDALRWVCKGIISKAWPKEHAEIYTHAERLARTTAVMLSQQGRVVESKSFEEEIKQAKQRDLVVRINWTGEADLDIRVQEPAGTICSLSNPKTTSGGILIGDTSSSSEKANVNGYSEYYVCAQGFAGQYDVLVRRVWGQVSGGKATVEIYTDFGTPEQSFVTHQVDLSEKDALIQVAVKNGQRKETIADAQLANVQRRQIENGRAVLGQLGGANTPEDSDYFDYYAYRMRLRAANLNNNIARGGFGFPGGGAVGYQPVVETIQEGAFMGVAAVVSADRRYVRIAPSPSFQGIGEVFTFNSATGDQGQNQGGTGGFGGGGLGQGGGQGGGIF